MLGVQHSKLPSLDIGSQENVLFRNSTNLGITDTLGGKGVQVSPLVTISFATLDCAMNV